jgi:hypothetical protein
VDLSLHGRAKRVPGVRLGLVLFPDPVAGQSIALVMAALVAFTPQFIFMSMALIQLVGATGQSLMHADGSPTARRDTTDH